MRVRLIVSSSAMLGAIVLGSSEAAARAQSKPAAKGSSPGQVIALKMERALAHAKHLEAVGVLKQGAVPATKFRFRFQAPDRESVVRFGGLLSRVRVAGRPLTQVREVTIGKTLYQSIDGKNWSRGPRPLGPSPLDVLTLDGANIPCCNAAITGNAIAVRYMGTQKVSGRQVYVLDFRTADRGDLVTTRMTVSASTYLPLTYVATSQPPRAVSQVTLRYTSKFKIAQPH